MKVEAEMNPKDLSKQVEWVWVGQSWRDEAGGRWPVGGRGKVPIKTSRAIPTYGGAGHADFAKVREEQEKCTHLEQVGAL